MATVPGESPLGPLNGWVPDSTAFAYGLPGTLEPVPFFDPAGLCEGKSLDEVKMVRAVNPAFFELLTFAIGCAELYRALNGWIAPTSTTAGKVSLELPDGALRALQPDYYPGDVGFDPLNLKPQDPVEFAEMATKELQHGRLAMIAVAGFFAQELVDNKLILADIYKIGI